MNRFAAISASAMLLASVLACEDDEPLVPNGAEKLVAILVGPNEVPSRNTTGYGVFEASVSGTTMTYTLKVSELTNVTAAHIHTGVVGVNGGIVVNLFTGPVVASTGKNFTLSSGTINQASITATGLTFDQLVAGMRTGQYYINVHTTALPGGEIRGATSAVVGIQ
jgi:hypothetical protein